MHFVSKDHYHIFKESNRLTLISFVKFETAYMYLKMSRREDAVCCIERPPKAKSERRERRGGENAALQQWRPVSQSVGRLLVSLSLTLSGS